MVDRKLELVFIDKDGKWYPLDEVSRGELAEGLEKILWGNCEETVIGERAKIEQILSLLFSAWKTRSIQLFLQQTCNLLKYQRDTSTARKDKKQTEELLENL
jgi:hypothetical protein